MCIGSKILVVEDSEAIAEFYKDVLESEGHKVSIAINGKEELERKGFDFKYYTNVFSQNTNNTYYFCFDYGYLKLEEKEQYIPVAWQSYME